MSGCGCAPGGSPLPSARVPPVVSAASNDWLGDRASVPCGTHSVVATTGPLDHSSRGEVLRPPPAGECSCAGGCSCTSGCANGAVLVADASAASPFPQAGGLSPRRMSGTMFADRPALDAERMAQELMDAWDRRDGLASVGATGQRRVETVEPTPGRARSSAIVLRAIPGGVFPQSVSSTASVLDAAKRITQLRKSGETAGWMVACGTEGDGWIDNDVRASGYIAGPSSHKDALLVGAGSPEVELTYRSESFTFDWMSWIAPLWFDFWWLDYAGVTSNGLVSSTSEALVALWEPMFRRDAAAGGGFRTLVGSMSVVGCWGIPPTAATEMDFVFWQDAEGAPPWLWLMSATLVHAYADEARDYTTSADCGGVSCCEGYVDFLKSVIVGGEGTSSTFATSDPGAARVCQIRANFPGDDLGDSRVFDPGAPATARGPGCGEKVDCAKFPQPSGGPGTCTPSAWNTWYTPSTSYAEYLYADRYLVSDPSGWSPTATFCGRDNGGPAALPTGPDEHCGVAVGQNWNIYAGAGPFTWDAFTCDAILFLSRIIYDYARVNIEPTMYAKRGPGPAVLIPNPEFVEAVGVARRMSGYALRIIAQRGYHLIHEIGHTYLGNNHCTGWKCCFELAAQRWLCQVEGQLGLPFCEYYADPETGLGDWLANSQSAVADNCADLNASGPDAAKPYFSCSVPTAGVRAAASDVVFSTASCDSADAGSARVWL